MSLGLFSSPGSSSGSSGGGGNVVVTNFPAVQTITGTITVNNPGGSGGSVFVAVSGSTGLPVAAPQGAPLWVTGSFSASGGSPSAPTYVSVTSSLPVTSTPTSAPLAGTGTLTVVSGTATSTTLLNANTARKGLCAYNDDNSIADFFIRFGTPCQPTLYSLRLSPGTSYDSTGAYVYDGLISYCSDTVSGSLYVTEFTA